MLFQELLQRVSGIPRFSRLQTSGGCFFKVQHRFYIDSKRAACLQLIPLMKQREEQGKNGPPTYRSFPFPDDRVFPMALLLSAVCDLKAESREIKPQTHQSNGSWMFEQCAMIWTEGFCLWTPALTEGIILPLASHLHTCSSLGYC